MQRLHLSSKNNHDKNSAEFLGSKAVGADSLVTGLVSPVAFAAIGLADSFLQNTMVPHPKSLRSKETSLKFWYSQSMLFWSHTRALGKNYMFSVFESQGNVIVNHEFWFANI